MTDFPLTSGYRAVGVDLAAQPKDTAICVLEATDLGVRIGLLGMGVSDPEILEWLTLPAVVKAGIDAPFGWPSEFLAAVSEYALAGRWPNPPAPSGGQGPLRLRVTDRVVADHPGPTPLSVSSDRIAAVAMRCARILSTYWQTSGTTPDRLGSGKAVEVYPAAALRAWQISQHDHHQDPGTYKGSTAGAGRRRARIVRAIQQECASWLELSIDDVEACTASDHVLDALISGIVATAAHAGQTDPPLPEAPEAEGWIAVPSMPLSSLGGEPATEATVQQPELLKPAGGYLELSLPDRFTLEIQDRIGGPFVIWASGLDRESFIREPDGSYVCTDHGGSPIYFRALSISDSGTFETVDGDGMGTVYRYRLRQDTP